MRKLSVGLLGGLVAWVGFAGAANASATIDLIWEGGGTATAMSSSSSDVALDIVVTAGPGGVQSFGLSVTYDPGLTVTGFSNGAAFPLEFTLGITEDLHPDETRVRNFNATSFNPATFVMAGSTYLAGTITFHVGPGGGPFNLAPVFLGTDAMAKSGFGNITSTVTLNGAIVPEPTTALLYPVVLGSLALLARRRLR